jgi:hypothetical protein
MTTKLTFNFERGPFILPTAQDVAVYSGSSTFRLAVTVQDENGLPAVIFIPIPKALLPDLMRELSSLAQGA